MTKRRRTSTRATTSTASSSSAAQLSNPDHYVSAQQDTQVDANSIRDMEVQSIIDSEVDLEILMHERLVKRLECRVQLVDSLVQMLSSEEDESNTSGWTGVSGREIRETAVEALRLIDQSTNFLFVPPPSEARTPTPASVTSGTASTTSSAQAPGSTQTGPSSRQRERSFHKPRKIHFLYTQPLSLQISGTNKGVKILRCPSCSRTSFTALQGLLNHSRLSHQVQYASHDECALACAVSPEDLGSQIGPIDFKDVDIRDGLLVGTGEGAGKVRGLRRLFEDAVGVGKYDEAMATAGPIQEDEPQFSGTGSQLRPTYAGKSTEVTKSLGYHSETPALAQFLGKEAVKQGIKTAVDENELVDVDRPATKHRWRRSLGQRNTADRVDDNPPPEQKDVAVKSSSVDRMNLPPDGIPLTPQQALGSGSRFYIPARVVISDHSLWIEAEEHYKWMITVDSPGYSQLHVSSFVSSLRVQQGSSDNLDASPAFECDTYPFYVLGNTESAFLAKIELQMVSGQTLFAEHWVDIDVFRHATPTLGDEQIRDFDLDKNIVFAAPKKRAQPSWDVVPIPRTKAQPTQQLEEWEKLLKELTKRFPMTMIDYKRSETAKSLHSASTVAPAHPVVDQNMDPTATEIGSTKRARTRTNQYNAAQSKDLAIPGIPYRLVATPQALRGMAYGKRKALEWARACAIQEAYTASNQNTGLPEPSSTNRQSYAMPLPENPETTLVPLTVGDVFAWLEDNGHFLWQGRVRPKQIINVDEEPTTAFNASHPSSSKGAKGKTRDMDKWCRLCGLLERSHPVERIRAEKAKAARMKKAKAGVQVENLALKMEVDAPPSEYSMAAVQGGSISAQSLSEARLTAEPKETQVKMEIEEITTIPPAPPTSTDRMELDETAFASVKPVPVKTEDTAPTYTTSLLNEEPQEPYAGFKCDVVVSSADLDSGTRTMFPMLDIKPFLAANDATPTRALDQVSKNPEGVSYMQSPDKVVQLADPQLLQAIASLVARFPQLSTFPSLTTSSSSELDESLLSSLPSHSLSKDDLSTKLIPYAMLSLLTRSFLKRLIGMATRVADEDFRKAKDTWDALCAKDEYLSLGGKKRIVMGKRLLLPSHFMRTLAAAGKTFSEPELRPNASLLGSEKSFDLTSPSFIPHGQVQLLCQTSARELERNVAIVCRRLGVSVDSETDSGFDFLDEDEASEDDDDDDEDESFSEGGIASSQSEGRSDIVDDR